MFELRSKAQNSHTDSKKKNLTGTLQTSIKFKDLISSNEWV